MLHGLHCSTFLYVATRILRSAIQKFFHYRNSDVQEATGEQIQRTGTDDAGCQWTSVVVWTWFRVKLSGERTRCPFSEKRKRRAINHRRFPFSSGHSDRCEEYIWLCTIVTGIHTIGNLPRDRNQSDLIALLSFPSRIIITNHDLRR